MKRITKKIYLVIAVIVGAITTVSAWTLWKVIDPARAPLLYVILHCKRIAFTI
jgi:hypothetical protein